MRAKGTITSWNDEKGYGFIAPMTEGERLFAHVKGFTGLRRRPAIGDVVTYTVSADARGRPRAEAITIAGMQPSPRRAARTRMPQQALAAGFLLLVGAASVFAALPKVVLLLYLVVSVVTFAAYALDKAAAKNGSRRTPEATLHLMSLAGGWPGALVAQSRLRHKSVKQPFRTVFWVTVLVNCGLLVWLLATDGAWLLDAVAVGMR